VLTFAAIGHVTNDYLATGIAPGGTAVYSTLAAAGLGLSARVITSHGPDFVGLPLLEAAGITVEGGGGARTTTFEERYEGGVRHARVLAIAEPLVTPADADIVFCGPVVGEVAASALAGRLVGVGLQGWLRRFGPRGVVERYIPEDFGFVAGGHAVFCSVEDLGAAHDRVVADLRARVPIVVVTEGARGSVVHTAGTSRHVPAYPTREVDPTGAGDVFATAFLIALARGESPHTAAIWGASAASIVIEDVGPAALSRIGETAARVERLGG